MKKESYLYKLFLDTIVTYYSKLGICEKNPEGIVPFAKEMVELNPMQKQILENGTGQKSHPKQYRQVNSSTGLVVNFYKTLENENVISNLIFEDKLGRPLKRGFPVNLDASYNEGNDSVYIESKFLEPYYNYYKANESNSASYFLPNKYDNSLSDSDIPIWIDVFKEAEKFQIYNVAQLSRHLLAIYRTHINEHTTNIVLQSVVWKMTPKFIDLLEDKEVASLMSSRVNQLDKEKEMCVELFDQLKEKLHWSNFTFKAVYYNDIISYIKESEQREQFKIRYFLD